MWLYGVWFWFKLLYLNDFVVLFYSGFIRLIIIIQAIMSNYWAKTQSKCFVLCYIERLGIEQISPFTISNSDFHHALFGWFGEPIK